jgi:type VI protein secretion system component Hcp
MALRGPWSAWTLVALLLAPGIAAADSEVFMCIPDIPGSSADVDFQGCSSIFGVAHSVEAVLDPGSGRAPPRATCNPYQVSKTIDQASGPILNRLLRGRAIDDVEFAIRQTGENPLVVFELFLSTVQLVRIEQDFAAAADYPIELIAMLPRSVRWRFTPQNADGGPGTPLEFSLSCS